ncbi:venom acid phosphatase Acph-1-like [Thrips palmi]|uniref:acid phosphatase n=1 Tax=Thrips palmi TaxID=161013 RepID=A0A6P9AHQ7_THRPL|nr:venom acid phosphatase Acph-1-like [Thrips palmi]
MARESTATSSSAALSPAASSSSASACSMSPGRRGRGGALAAVVLVLLLLGVLQAAQAAARIRDLDDALVGDIKDLKDIRDNRVRPEQGGHSKDELLLVHVMFRHGDRTPDPPTYPTDPYGNFSYFPFGWGNLTPAGRRTEFRLGKFLRQRYEDFLGSYRSGVVYARTTDWPRTKDSMALVLAGLFPPAKQNVWGHDGEDLGYHWMPIPADTKPRDQDKLLYMWDVPCPAYDKEFQDVLASQTFQKQFRGSNEQLINYLQKYSGAQINTPEDVYNIYQALLGQSGFNLTLPHWTKEVFPDKMKPLTALYFEVDSWTRKMQRLRAGPLLKRILHTSVSRAEFPDRKLYLYAAHDNNVSALLRALQVWQSSLPPYGTAIIVEVRKKAGQVGVQLFMRNSTATDDLHSLTLPNCEHFCPLHRFVKLTEEVIPDDWEAECKS